VKVKIGKRPEGLDHHIWYEYVSDLLKFTNFLDKAFPGWTYYNVYNRVSGGQIGSFTKFKRPVTKNLI